MSELADALLEGLAALEGVAASTFAFGATQFEAWPVEAAQIGNTPITNTRTASFTFETRAAISFKPADTLAMGSKRFTVSEVGKRNPITGTIRFVVGEGRAT